MDSNFWWNHGGGSEPVADPWGEGDGESASPRRVRKSAFQVHTRYESPLFIKLR